MPKIIFPILVFLVGLAVSVSGFAQLDSVRSRYNEAIDMIVKQIKDVKSGYPELESFSDSAVNLGQDGFKNIFYVRESSADPSGKLDPYAYQFSIGIKSLDGTEENGTGSDWEVRFPLLGIRVVMDSQRKGEWASVDLRRIVEHNLDGLKSLEQEYLPFRLELNTEKQVYSVAEEINLTVTLRNMGSKPFQVAQLDENGLYCTIGDIQWGNSDFDVRINRVLNGHATLQKMLRINGPETAQDMSITCTYGLGYKGVQPYARIKVSIQPKS